MKSSTVLVLGALIAISACDDGPVGAAIELDDPGRACLVPESEVPAFDVDPSMMRSYAAGGRVKALVDMDICLSSSCDVDRKQACAIALDGNTLTVTATVSWRTSGANECTSDCGRPRPGCTSDPLPAGSYTLRYRGQTTSFDVPGDIAAPCVGSPSDNTM